MFNFKELKLNKEVNETDPFVGIRRSKSGDGMEFRLPRGFADFPENNFDETKKLFFRMYRTFKKFERDHSGRYIDKKQGKRDNIERQHHGYNFLDSEGSEVVLYSKISVIENLLEAYEDLSLDVIERQIGIDEEIDYSKIDKYLDKAIYQEENIDEYVIYIDSMELPRNVIQYKSATLIDMFCFILHEVNNELEQGTDSRVGELSSKFKEQHLSCDQSLFNEDTFEETIITLKDLLQNIDKSTAYKDNDYWRLYESIESFLYGELDMNNPHADGVFWGISNFYQIWEDMCNTYMFSKNYDVLYSDTNIVYKRKKDIVKRCFGGNNVLIKEGFDNPFYLKFRDVKNKWLRPDIVHYYKNYNLPKFIELHKENEDNGELDFSIKLLSGNGEKAYRRVVSVFKSKSNNYNERKKDIEFKRYNSEQFNNCIEAISVKNDSCIYILDWKYKDASFFLAQSHSVDEDINKQLCYELCLQFSTKNHIITNQLVIPFFSNSSSLEDKIGYKIDKKYLYARLNETKIEIFKANFYTMQNAYLNYD